MKLVFLFALNGAGASVYHIAYFGFVNFAVSRFRLKVHQTLAFIQRSPPAMETVCGQNDAQFETRSFSALDWPAEKLATLRIAKRERLPLTDRAKRESNKSCIQSFNANACAPERMANAVQ